MQWAASVKEPHGGNRDYYQNRQAQMENEADEHGVAAQDQGNLSVLAFASILGDGAIEEN